MTICLLAYQFANTNVNVGSSGSGISNEVGGWYEPITSTNNEGGDDHLDQQQQHHDYYHNLARLFTSSFLFLTGFSHAMYFNHNHHNNQYQQHGNSNYNGVTTRRLLHVIFRLNLGVITLCLALDTPYITYDACAMHTYSFVISYGVMRWRRERNGSNLGVRFKFACLAMGIFMVWDCDLWKYVPTVFHYFNGGGLREFYFRAHLHHWSSFIGMLFAINHPVSSLLMRKLEAMTLMNNSYKSIQGVISKVTMGIVLLCAVGIWWIGPFDTSTYIYDATNPYFTFIPILCYVYFRNVTPAFQQHHIELFKTIGIFSLEIYILHHHLLLSSSTTGGVGNGRSRLLHLLPGYPSLNILLTVISLLLLARVLKTTTTVITASLLTNNTNNNNNTSSNNITIRAAADTTTRNNVGVLITILALVHVISLLLYSMRSITISTVSTVTIIFGYVLYQTILDATWSRYRSSSRMSAPDNQKYSRADVVGEEDEATIVKMSPPIIGTMVLFLLGIGWRVVLTSSGGTTIPTISNNAYHNNINRQTSVICGRAANEGIWTTLDLCTQFQKGILEREHTTGFNYGECTGMDTQVHQWAWVRNSNRVDQQRYQPSSSHCNLHYRSPPELLQNHLSHHHILFIGDVTTRHLFHATCRALGDTNAGAYDSISSSVDSMESRMVRYYGSDTVVEFWWAPLANDILAKLKVVRQQQQQQGGGGTGVDDKIDLVVAGGGAWDALHTWATEDDAHHHYTDNKSSSYTTTTSSSSHKIEQTIKLLAEEIFILQNQQQTQTSSSSLHKNIPTIWITPTTIHTAALDTPEKRSRMSESNVARTRHIYHDLGVTTAAGFVLDGSSFTEGRVGDSWDGLQYPRDVYDVGAQILMNSLDWLLVTTTVDSSPKGVLGSLANPLLGMMVLCVVLIGLVFHDGYFGVSFLPSIFVRNSSSNNQQKQQHFAALLNNNTSRNIEQQQQQQKQQADTRFSLLPGDLYIEACHTIRRDTKKKSAAAQAKRDVEDCHHHHRQQPHDQYEDSGVVNEKVDNELNYFGGTINTTTTNTDQYKNSSGRPNMSSSPHHRRIGKGSLATINESRK